MISFFKQIFIWWHRQTIGTFLYTLFTGKYVGTDQFGNKYYSNSKGKRWVVYINRVESSKIPPEWHSWIHFTKLKKPTDFLCSTAAFLPIAKARAVFPIDGLPASMIKSEL